MCCCAAAIYFACVKGLHVCATTPTSGSFFFSGPPCVGLIPYPRGSTTIIFGLQRVHKSCPVLNAATFLRSIRGVQHGPNQLFFLPSPAPNVDPGSVLNACLLQFITAECHEKASALVLESVTQGCSAWLRFEPDVVALSILLLAIGTTSSRHDLLNRVSLDWRCCSRVRPVVL